MMSKPRTYTDEQLEHKRQRARDYYWENVEEKRRKKREEAAADRQTARTKCAKYARENKDKISARQKENRKTMTEEEKERERERSRQYQRRNKEQIAKRKRESRRKNPEKFYNEKSRARCREYNKNNREKIMKRIKSNPDRLKANKLKPYGMTIAEFDELLVAQGGKCAICGMSSAGDSKIFPVIDHCHTNKHVRGILCANCNRGLGMFRDSPALLRKAAKYVERNGLFGPITK
jgi:hypothetical protein